MNNHTRMALSLLSLWLVGAMLLVACGPGKPKTITVGIFDPIAIAGPVEGFKAGLTDLQYAEGERIQYVEANKPAGFDLTSLEASAKELVEAKVDLIYCVSTSACLAAKNATVATDIPVLFVAVSDPITVGLVQDFVNPGGNVTGIASATIGSTNEGIRLEWLVKISNAKRIFLPYGANDSATAAKLIPVQEMASKLGVELVLFEINTPEEAAAVSANIPEDVQAMFTFSERIFTIPILTDLANAAIARKLSYSAPGIEYGALMSYAPDLVAMGKQSARLADQVFDGVKPEDLPVETSEFFMNINLKTAEAIGLNIPDDVLGQADRIIR